MSEFVEEYVQITKIRWPIDAHTKPLLLGDVNFRTNWFWRDSLKLLYPFANYTPFYKLNKPSSCPSLSLHSLISWFSNRNWADRKLLSSLVSLTTRYSSCKSCQKTLKSLILLLGLLIFRFFLSCNLKGTLMQIWKSLHIFKFM